MRQFANDHPAEPHPEPHYITVDRLERETEKAICVLDATGRKLWIPKSICNVQRRLDDDRMDIELPTWFWEKEGLEARF